MKKLLLGLVVLVLAYVVASPWITVYQMKQAADAQDGEQLSEYIDFPSVRQSLKDQLNARVLGEIDKDEDANPMAALGASFAGMVVERMVDAYVTPAAITEMMKGDTPKEAPEKPRDLPPSEPGEEPEPLADARMGYADLNRFVIELEAKDAEDKPAKFVLRRRGMGWQLTEILLP